MKMNPENNNRGQNINNLSGMPREQLAALSKEQLIDVVSELFSKQEQKKPINNINSRAEIKAEQRSGLDHLYKKISLLNEGKGLPQDAWAAWDKIKNDENLTPEQQTTLKAKIKTALTRKEKPENFALNAEEADQMIEALSEYKWDDEAERYIGGTYSEDEKNVIEKYFQDPNGILTLIGTDGKFSKENRILFKKQVKRIFNKLYEKIDSQPNRQFREEFSDFHEGATFRYLKNQLEKLKTNHLIREKKVSFGEGKEEMLGGFLESVIREVNIYQSWKEMYHDIWIYAKDPAMDKWAGYVGRNYVSEVSIFLNDSERDINPVELARMAFERYLQAELVKNGNRLRSDFLAGVFSSDSQEYSQPDLKNIKEYYNQILKEKGIELEDWEVNANLTLGKGISFINTLRIPEIVATALPPKAGDFKGNFLYNLAAFFNPQWNWGVQRALLGDYGADPTMHNLIIPELTRIPIIIDAKTAGKAKDWVPKDFYDKHFGEDQSYKVDEKLGEKIDQSWLDSMGEYGKLMRIFSIHSLNSRAGWRFEGIGELKKDIKKQIEKTGKNFASDAEWEKAWNDEYLIRYIGAGACWYSDGGKAGADLRNLVGNILEKKGMIDRNWKSLPDEAWGKIWNEFTGGQKDMEITAFGLTGNMSEITDARDSQYKGYTFFRLLERSPLDFMYNITQMVPELNNEKALSEYFIDDVFSLPNTTPEQAKKISEIKMFQNKIKQKWGEGNYIHLKKVAEVWSKLRHSAKKTLEDAEKNKYTDEKYKNLKGVSEQDYIRNILTFAVEGVRDRKDIKMNENDIKDEEIRKIIFGGNGLMDYFKVLGDREKQLLALDKSPDERPQAGRIDKSSFFYRMGKIWFKEEEVGTIPNTAEIDHGKIYKYISKAGEDMNKRLIGDVAKWNETVGKLLHLDKLLLGVAQSGKMDEIIKLHGELTSIKGVVGERRMHEAQYYIASLVGKFFQQHHYTTMPIIGPFASFMVGDRNLSLSNIHFGRTAYSMNSNELNNYFQQLWKTGVIAEKGPWSFDQISKAFKVDWKTMLTKQVIPNVSFYLMLFLLWKSLKEGSKELVEPKK